MSESKALVLISLGTFVFVCIVVVAIYLWQNREQFTTARKPAYPRPNDVFVGLREQILKGSRAKFNLGPTQNPTEPWGIVMDWGVNNGIASVVVLSDGHASIYTSGGGGSLGGQSHESIRAAAQKAVGLAPQFQAQARLTTTFPLPARGEVIFYFLTDAGVLTEQAPESELRTGRHRLSKLGNAMQQIVTDYRLLQTGASW